MNKIVLQYITVDGSLVKYRFSVNNELKRYFATDVMFLQYEQSMTDVPLSILSIPFVNCMAGLSWLSDAMLFVDEIDEPTLATRKLRLDIHIIKLINLNIRRLGLGIDRGHMTYLCYHW